MGLAPVLAVLVFVLLVVLLLGAVHLALGGPLLLIIVIAFVLALLL